MFLLGLTGDIASGKSTVARLLQERGATHLDADALVHELYRDPDFAQRLQRHLQTFAAHRVLDIVDENGAIVRSALGLLVFGDKVLLRHLEEFVHPAVAALRAEKLQELQLQSSPESPSIKSSSPVVVLEAVKLVESGQIVGCDALWWVTASRATQMRRLTQDRGLSEEAARERLSNQPPQEEKIVQIEKCGVPWRFLSNDGSRAALQESVAAAWQELQISKL